MPKLKRKRYEGNGEAANLPVPGGKSRAEGESRDRRSRRFRRISGGRGGVVEDVAGFLSDYVVLPRQEIIVVSAWTLAAWLAVLWDRFPHLAVTSPDRRCGKTRLLELLEWVAPNPHFTSNISPAALYRLIAAERPTLLLDEAQSIRRRASEMSEVLRELLNAGIGKQAVVLRCGGKDHDKIQQFKIYSPKVLALIGKLDGVLADRCLTVAMKRKSKDDVVLPYRSRVVEPRGKALHERLAAWAKRNAKKIAKAYDNLPPYAIRNDRMAELLLPLQAVLTVADPSSLESLESYAFALDRRDRDTVSPGVVLLAACRSIFDTMKSMDEFRRTKSTDSNGTPFLRTQTLIAMLVQRDEEPWRRWSKGQGITPHALAGLLRPFGIRSDRDKAQQSRGYYRYRFEDAWTRYLPPTFPGEASKPSKASIPQSTTE